jgi:hypothetical protein
VVIVVPLAASVFAWAARRTGDRPRRLRRRSFPQ